MSSNDQKTTPGGSEGINQRNASQQSKSPSPPAVPRPTVGVVTVHNGDEQLLAKIGYQQVLSSLDARFHLTAAKPGPRSSDVNSRNGPSHRMPPLSWECLALYRPCSRFRCLPADRLPPYGAGLSALALRTASHALV